MVFHISGGHRARFTRQRERQSQKDMLMTIANYGVYIKLLDDDSWIPATSDETSSDDGETLDTGPAPFSPTSNSSSTRCPRDIEDYTLPRRLHRKETPLGRQRKKEVPARWGSGVPPTPNCTNAGRSTGLHQTGKDIDPQTVPCPIDTDSDDETDGEVDIWSDDPHRPLDGHVEADTVADWPSGLHHDATCDATAAGNNEVKHHNQPAGLQQALYAQVEPYVDGPTGVHRGSNKPPEPEAAADQPIGLHRAAPDRLPESDIVADRPTGLHRAASDGASVRSRPDQRVRFGVVEIHEVEKFGKFDAETNEVEHRVRPDGPHRNPSAQHEPSTDRPPGLHRAEDIGDRLSFSTNTSKDCRQLSPPRAFLTPLYNTLQCGIIQALCDTNGWNCWTHQCKQCKATVDGRDPHECARPRQRAGTGSRRTRRRRELRRRKQQYAATTNLPRSMCGRTPIPNGWVLPQSRWQ